MRLESFGVEFWVIVGLMVLVVAMLSSFMASLYRKAGPHATVVQDAWARGQMRTCARLDLRRAEWIDTRPRNQRVAGGDAAGDVCVGSWGGVALSAERVELLKEAVPTVATLAIFWNPTHPQGPTQAKDAQAAATQTGLNAHLVPVRSAQEVDAAFATLAKRSYGLLITDDTLLINQTDRLASLAIERRLPGISGLRTFAEGGGLMSYGPSLAEQFQGAALYVDRIIKGARPADLPVIQPTKFDLLVNLRTARALKLKVPESILLRADEIIR